MNELNTLRVGVTLFPAINYICMYAYYLLRESHYLYLIYTNCSKFYRAIANMDIKELMQIIMLGNLHLINLLKVRGLLKPVIRYPMQRWRSDMVMQVRNNINDGYHWKYPRRRCGKRKSIRSGSCFANSKLPLGDIVCIIYAWAIVISMSATSTFFSISHHTVIDWYNLIREECSAKLLR